MPENAYAHGETKYASDPVALLKRQYRDLEELFRRIGKSENADERRRLLDLIIQKLTLRRVLAVLLKDDRPLCERWLADYARVALARAVAMLDNLRRVIAINAQRGECRECGQLTQTFSLAKTYSRPTRESASQTQRTYLHGLFYLAYRFPPGRSNVSGAAPGM